MELIISTGVLTVLLLIGAFIDVLRGVWSPDKLSG